jgi:hypothetical protein
VEKTVNRKSLVGPILLIALGVLFLAHNIWPAFSLHRLFAAHWPWILIVWGGFRLVEYAVAWVTGRPAPQPMGPAGYLAALLLVLAGSVAHSIGPRAFPFWHWHDRVFDLRGEAPSPRLPRIPRPPEL